MKLWTKIVLIAAAVTAALGMVGIVVGFAMGADVSDLNKMGIYLTPHQQVQVKKVITDNTEESMKNNTKNDDMAGDNHHTAEVIHNDDLYSYSCSLQDIERLKIEVKNAEITIFGVEEAVSINYFSNRGNEISKKDGSTLRIEDHGIMNEKIELEIFIPIGVLKEIEIDAAAGTVTADKVVADRVSLEIDAASVRIDELIVENEAELQINAGEIVIGYYDGTKLDAECDMGSIMIVCEGNRNDYNYDLECGMGEIRIDEDIYSEMRENIRVNNGGKKSIQAECGVGEILLEFPNSL